MKKAAIQLLAIVLAFSLAACGTPASSSAAPASDSASSASTPASAASASAPASASTPASSQGQEIQVEKELFDVTVTLPADLVGETTQEELEATMSDQVHSATLNEDGSVTYVMSKSQHKALMESTRESIETSLEELIGSEEYPNFQKIEHNDDFTSFTVTTASTELDLSESFSSMLFYIYGGMYNAFNGTQVDNIHVDFVNADTGDIIKSYDSSQSSSGN